MSCCKVTWCNEETEFYNRTQRRSYCKKHYHYKKYAANAAGRPWLMYKLEKILEGKGSICEKCGDDLCKRFPDRILKDIIQFYCVNYRWFSFVELAS